MLASYKPILVWKYTEKYNDQLNQLNLFFVSSSNSKGTDFNL